MLARETGYPNKRAQTRGRLVRAAMECMARRGVASTTIGEVAAEAGVVPGTFYNHFQTKDDLVAAAVELLVGTLEDAAEAIRTVEVDPAAQLAWGTVQLVDTAGADPTWGAAFTEFIAAVPAMRERVRVIVDDVIALGAKQHRFSVVPDATLSDAVVGIAVEAIRSRSCHETGPDSAVATAGHILRVVGVPKSASARVLRLAVLRSRRPVGSVARR